MTETEKRTLIDELRDGTPLSGLRNCHHVGLHSIVLEQRPDGSLRRIFYANGHRLDRLFTERGHFTVGAHNHDKPLTFSLLFGQCWNVTLNGEIAHDYYYRYPFGSALQGGTFELGAPEKESGRLIVGPIDGLKLGTEAIHTVLVPSPSAAWLVDEGPAENVEKHIYSPRDDLALEPVGLYQPMDATYLRVFANRIALAMQADLEGFRPVPRS